MQIGINDLDDDDLLTGGTSPEPPQLPAVILNVQQPTGEENNDYLSDFLKTRGIDDMSKILFEDELGGIEERSWNSLTKEEKLNILNTPLETQGDNQLSNEEILLINLIRDSKLTPSEYLEQLSSLSLAPLEPQYKIDDYSDEELFILDLESRVGELTEEMAAQALNSAKENEELFKKLVEGIRKEYKEREDYLLQLQEAELQLQQQEAYNKFLDSVINQIDQFESIGNLNLNFDDSDKEELALFMLSRDEAGNNYLWLALQDPETLVKAAWFILNGEEAFNNISDYFINLIKLVSENQYRKGFEEGKNGKEPSRPLVVINNKQQQTHQRPSYSSINDLDDDD